MGPAGGDRSARRVRAIVAVAPCIAGLDEYLDRMRRAADNSAVQVRFTARAEQTMQ